MPHTFLSTLTGAFAYPVAENPTVAIMEAAYTHHNIDARYLNCEVTPEQLGDAVRGAVAMGWAGFNCSIPNKVEVIAYLDELADSARLIGAVNCVINRDGYLVGENTDGKGFVESLRTVADPVGQHFFIMGAGGAARAIAVESALAGAASITITNRDAARGQLVVDIVAKHTPASATFVPWIGDAVVPANTDIVVNATSIGLFPDSDARVPLAVDSLCAGQVVADVIHNPPMTRLLTDAAAHGCVILDGRGMLVNQARVNMFLWTGIDANGAVMRAVLDDLFGASTQPI